MSFTYITNIPFAGNDPSVDQPNMQTNTNAINAWVQVDHIGFNTGTAGQHQKVTFPAVPTVAPTVTGDAGVLYTGLVSSIAQLFFANSAGAQQITGYSVTTTTNLGTAGGTINQINLPGNITIYCGVTGSLVSSARTILLPTAYTTGYVCVGCQNGLGFGPFAVGMSFASGSQINIGISSTASAQWLAIGTLS